MIDGLDLTGTVAETLQGTADEKLFWSLCEFLEPSTVTSTYATTRYSPNTRARALQAYRHVWALKMEAVTE